VSDLKASIKTISDKKKNANVEMDVNRIKNIPLYKVYEFLTKKNLVKDR